MAFLPPLIGPRTALRDLKSFLSHRSREQKIGAALAVLVTSVILILFIVDSSVNTAPPATIHFVESWPANRTDEEIIADQEKRQAEKDKLSQEKQREFQKLENTLGM